MNIVYTEINGIARKALGWVVTFMIAGLLAWAAWTTTTLIDIRVSLGVIQQRGQGIENLVNPPSALP